MYKDILGVLHCPICLKNFQLHEQQTEREEVIEGVLVCCNNHRYAVHKGVIDFCSQEQENMNQWSELIENHNYEKLDKTIEAEKTAKEREQQQLHLNSITEPATQTEKGYIVDIASGRGMLLTKLAEKVKDSVHLIATDLSFDILMYDRIKLKKINPTVRVSFIACDATAMPLKSGFADMVVSFFGIANMLGIVDKGVKEAARITKENGTFLNGFLVIKEDSKGFEMVKQICDENNMHGAERTYLDEVMRKLHEEHFSKVITHEVVADIHKPIENQLDLLPYQGEWFAYVTYEGKK